MSHDFTVFIFISQRASPLRNVMYQFFRFAKKNNVALDIGFETKLGYSLILARAFNDVSVTMMRHYIVVSNLFLPGDNNIF